MKGRLTLLCLVLALSLTGCNLDSKGSGQGSGSGISVAVSPGTATVTLGSTQQFTATVTGSTDNRVMWSVNGTVGGNATTGTITNAGLYTPPKTIPSPATVEVSATSVADAKSSGQSSVTVKDKALTVKVQISPSTSNVSLGTTQQFTATLTGTTDMRIEWSVNGVPSGSSGIGSISATGLYQPPATVPNPATVKITAASVADPRASADAMVTVKTRPLTVAVLVTPTNPSVMAGATQQFTAKVTGATDPRVVWSVNYYVPGNATLGTIDANGLYRAPAVAPNPALVQIHAVSVEDNRAVGTGVTTIKSVAVTLLPANPTLAVNATQQFTATVTGTSNTAVTWTVNGTAGGNATVGTIDANGLYIAPAVPPNPDTVTVVARSVADTNVAGSSQVKIFNPNPLVSDAAAARFLEQASWGPTQASISRVRQLGFDAYVNEQFATPASAWPSLGSQDGIDKLQKQFFINAVSGQDQLRQRVAFALGEVMVISNRKVDSHGFPYYIRLLHQDAFGNYATLLKDVTLSPAMGYYLDMVDNDKPNPNNGTAPNENYAREIMQLFSIGTMKLNQDGTVQTDAAGNPIPTYIQDTIEGFAHDFTGWTYPTQPGKTRQIHNPQAWDAPMEANDSNHDMNPKLLLEGTTLPAGQTAVKDLDDGIQNIVGNPNVGPFMCVRLIQQLVVSNPSPAYVSHCSAAFADNGSGVRGDLKAVVKAILLDAEARRGDDPTQLQMTDGKLKEPVLLMTGMLRALNATTDGDNLDYFNSNMQQDLYNPPTVFNFYPPTFRLESNNLLAPEFKIYTTPTSQWRANYVNSIVFWGWPDTTKINFAPWANLATDNTKLLDALNTAMMHGAMPDAMRQAITTALNALDPNDLDGRARTAIYLVATSQLYSVQH